MRGTPGITPATRHAAQRVLGPVKRIGKFGFMALDDRKSGDFDLFFETNARFSDGDNVICQL